ncbi:MAG TPA: M56 family metallopeptidase [Jiangellales bacterium]|nr:M56 family metallopeptidase [Jiangellales bacterium]
MMLLAALLVAYAAAVGMLGRPLLRRLTHHTRHPLLGVVTWLVACASVLAAWLVAGLLAAGWHLPAFADVIVGECLTSAESPDDHVHLTAPELALPALAASALRATWVSLRGYAAEARFRRRHVHAVRLVGRTDRKLGAIVVDAAEPAVYCVAGRRPTIVVTTQALDALSSEQLAAVLDHERCHLAERHHVLMGACRAVARAFPFVPLFREARSHVAALLEMRADDVAAKRHGARPVADALAAVAVGPPLGPALAAGGESALARANRLLPGAAGARDGGWRLALLIAALAVGPPAILLVPLCH